MKKLKKKNTILRRFFKILFLFLLVLSIYTAWQSVHYHPVAPLTNTVNAGPYLKGSYHMHSTYSDGKGTISHLVKSAKEAGLDWIILTDHGSPNLGSQHASGWYDGVLLIGASEHSSDAGHLVVIGASTDYKLPFEPQMAIDDLNHYQGLTFLAHPFDDKIPWTDPTVTRFTGIEIFSLYESVKSAPWYRILQFPIQYAFNPDYAILRMLTPPTSSLSEWNRYNRNSARPYMGIFAIDAHGRIPISRRMDIAIPSYKSMLSSLVIYHSYEREAFRKLSTQDAIAMVTDTLKSGTFFNVVETIAPADSLLYECVPDPPTATETASSAWVFQLGHNFNRVHLKLYRNGNLYREETVVKDLKLPLNLPGRYRAELYMPDTTFAELPWIVTNPVDLPSSDMIMAGKPELSSEISPSLFNTVSWDSFSVEKNEDSYAESVKGEDPDSLLPFTIMRYSLRIPTIGKDTWSSLSLRDKKIIRDHLQGQKGVYLEAAASRRCTVWLEVRTAEPGTGEELWYRHSLTLGREKTAMSIPYSAMKQINGRTKSLDSKLISAVFISINNSTAFIPAEGEIYLYQLGGYRE